MSRSGYSDDCDYNWSLIMWRGAVKSAITGKRGQAFFKEMLAALDALPVKRLVKDELQATDLVPCSHWGMFEATSVCAIGAVGRARGVDMTSIDPDDPPQVANAFGIAQAMAQEIVYVNDEWGGYRETTEQRFARVREWVASQIKQSSAHPKTQCDEP
jgi:hypothetical protein